MRIARADRAFEETQAAADEIVGLAERLQDRVRERGSLGEGDRKAIDRLKKLAKKIRRDFGGEGAPRLSDVPETIVALAEAIGERARDIDAHIDKATRYEVNSKLVVLAGDLMVLSDTLKSRGAAR
jgi:hypothetical protein